MSAPIVVRHGATATLSLVSDAQRNTPRTPIRFDSRDVLDVVLTFRAVTGWQIASALTGRLPSAVPLNVHEQILNGAVKALKGEGLIDSHLYFPRARAHKQVERRPQYRLTPDPAIREAAVAQLPPKLARLAAAMKPGVVYAEAALMRGGLQSYKTSWHRREQLKMLCKAGALEKDARTGIGRTSLITPTKTAWARFVSGPAEQKTGLPVAYRLPYGDTIHHHLLAVDAALDIQRETGWLLAEYATDEEVRSLARRGTNLRQYRGQTHEMLPDAVARFEVVRGAVTDVPIEVLTARYPDPVLANKAQLVEGTRFYTETPKLVARFARLTGLTAKYLPGDVTPFDVECELVVSSPLADAKRVARYEHSNPAR